MDITESLIYEQEYDRKEHVRRVTALERERDAALQRAECHEQSALRMEAEIRQAAAEIREARAAAFARGIERAAHMLDESAPCYCEVGMGHSSFCPRTLAAHIRALRDD